jgi:hypothetical protein
MRATRADLGCETAMRNSLLNREAVQRVEARGSKPRRYLLERSVSSASRVDFVNG